MIYEGLEWERGSEVLELQTAGVYFDLVQGFNEHPAVRGQDDVVPGRVGRYRRNRVSDQLVLELRGFIRGLGQTVEDRQRDFRETVTALKAALDPTEGAGTLRVKGPYLGLPDGSEATIEAYPVNWLGGVVTNTMSFQVFSIELEAIGPDLEWELTGPEPE